MSNDTKFKILYDVYFNEYERELDRSKAVEEKTAWLFALLNIIIGLIITILSRRDYWTLYSTHHIFFQCVEIMLIIFLGFCLIQTWFILLKNLKLRKTYRINVDDAKTELEDIVYDNDKDQDYLYWKISKTCKQAILENKVISNNCYNLLEESIKWLKASFVSFAILSSILILTFLQGVLS